MMIVVGNTLNLNDLERIIFDGEKIAVAPEVMERVERSYSFLKTFSKDKIIYGINTGFGPMAQYRIDDDSLTQLQYNIIRSHSTGAGEPLKPIYVRAAMVARLMTFLQAMSGVHTSLVELLVEFLNNGLYPFIPEHGSVGASGDLVQLSHIALALIGEGKLFYKGSWRNSAEVMAELGLKPLKMYIREGLSATNGTSVMSGIAVVNLIYAKRLFNRCVASSVMINEVVASYDDFLSATLNEAKRHRGQVVVAELMRKLLKNSTAIKRREIELYDRRHLEREFKHKVQPFYSLRCTPQVLGPIYDELENAERVVVNEINSACDNPIVDMDGGNVYHGGNFHGDYISYEMDKLKIAITKLTMLVERQLNYLFHDKINEILPPFVNMGVLGLNYGLQASQFTATSTTAECQTLSNPMYVHSIPNNNDNQDIVSMGTNSALIAARVVENSYQVLSILYMGLVQAVDILKVRDSLGEGSSELYNHIREIFPPFKEDTPKYEEIERIVAYLKQPVEIQ